MSGPLADVHERARPAEGRDPTASGPRPADRGGVAGALLALHGAAGNAAVAQRLAGDEAPVEASTTDEGAHGTCRGAGAVGQAGSEVGGDGGEAVPLSAGGTATRQLTWTDFPNGPGDETSDAYTQSVFSWSAGAYTAAFDGVNSWAKASAKTASGQAGLLRHEQYHFDLAVLMAHKTRPGAGGPTQAGVDSLVARYQAQSDLYDTETDHGTKAADQSRWEAKIDAGTVG